MDQIPSSIMFDIFSRVPTRCLVRSRCVSKVWCIYIDDRYLTNIHDKRVVEEPTPILCHHHISLKKKTLGVCFYVGEYKQAETTHLVFKPEKGPFLEFLCKKPLSISSEVRIEAQGSCNGLICLSQNDSYVTTPLAVSHVITSLVVIHPLRKECYELPPFLRSGKYMYRESCDFGFDAVTNTYKMVCVLLKLCMPPDKPYTLTKKLCTMVHVFGTNSWREIPKVPSYPVTGKAVFANGCLHWLASHSVIIAEDSGREIIWSDVNKEEFGLIDPPKECVIYGDSIFVFTITW